MRNDNTSIKCFAKPLKPFYKKRRNKKAFKRVVRLYDCMCLGIPTQPTSNFIIAGKHAKQKQTEKKKKNAFNYPIPEVL